jgi:hypothetical protein
MKTTIDLSDAIFFSAKQAALKQKTTLRALIEEGLRRVLSEFEAAPKPSFILENASIKGQMLLPDPAQWRELETDHLAATFASHTAP